jgi:basic amino acid/polyamine antiporter, APA family
MSQLFKTKSIAGIIAAAEQGGGLKRTLGAVNLIALGIGAIIGAGLFVRTAAAAAQAAGPAVTLSFIVAAIGCALAGLCYAEFAASVPISGSAYAYAYVTMGELVAWIIGWALIMEYALGAATVSIAWSEYLNKLLGDAIPHAWCHSPFDAGGGIMNVPALVILFGLTMILIRGTQESATLNNVLVGLKVIVVLVFIAVGFQYINPANYTPYFIPDDAPAVMDSAGKVLVDYSGWNKHGYGGVLGGAAIVFFAFIGFDAVSTTAQEAKNPARDMPIGILGSLAICTVLYILFGHVLTGVVNWSEFADPAKGKEASVAYAISTYMTDYKWLATAVTVAILAGFSSVILVMLMGQSRVFYSMSKDGLLPSIFGELHPTYQTPYKANWIVFAFVALFAGFIPGDVAGDLTSFGTLLAFVLVCMGILVMRVKMPDMKRPFATPLPWVVAPLGALICLGMIAALDVRTLLSALVWMAVGLVVYFTYGIKNSKLQHGEDVGVEEDKH